MHNFTYWQMMSLSTLIIIGLTIRLGIHMKNRLKLLWFRLLGKNHNQNHEHEIQFGELILVNKGKSEINIPCLPKRVKVEFIDGPNTIPCNPHHDKLTWDIERMHGKFKLVISWHVSGVREVKWVLFY